MNKIMISYVLCALLFFSILPWYSLAEEVSTKPTTETTPTTTTTENDSAEDTSPEHCKQMVDKLSESEFAALSLTFTPIINRFPELAEDNDKGNDLRHKIFDELFHNVVYYELNKHNTAEEASSASSSSSTTEDKEKTDTTETPATETTDTTTTDKDDKLKLSDPDSHIMDTDVAFSFYFINDLDTKQIEHFNEDNTEGWELTKKSLYTDDQLTCRFEAFTQLLYKIKDDKRTQKEKVRIVQRHMVEQELTMLHEQIAKLEQFQKELNDDETNDDKSSDNLIKNEDKPSPTPVSTSA